MKIKKVKYNGEVEITYFQKSASQELETFTMKSADEPEMKFNVALQAMKVFIPELIGVPKTWAECAVIIGVSISYSDGAEFGLVISGKRRIAGRDEYFCFNTPHTPFEEMPDFEGLDLIQSLIDLKACAVNYLNGQRAQQKLPFDIPKPIGEMTATELTVARLKAVEKAHGVTVTASVH